MTAANDRGDGESPVSADREPSIVMGRGELFAMRIVRPSAAILAGNGQPNVRSFVIFADQPTRESHHDSAVSEVVTVAPINLVEYPLSHSSLGRRSTIAAFPIGKDAGDDEAVGDDAADDNDGDDDVGGEDNGDEDDGGDDSGTNRSGRLLERVSGFSWASANPSLRMPWRAN
jgi:hypothetical protein